MAKRNPVDTWRMVAYVLVVALLIFLSGAVLGALAFQVSPIGGVDTRTKIGEGHTWRGGGQFHEEVLDAPQYVSGFKSDGFSEKIVAGAKVSRSQVSCVNPGNAVYEFWFKSTVPYPPANTFPPVPLTSSGHPDWVDETKNGWVLVKQDSVRLNPGGISCPDFLNAPASIMEIRGNYIGTIWVKFWVDWLDILHSGYHLMAHDQAPVQPGWGFLSIQNADSLVEIGENLLIHYDVGAACSLKEDTGTKPNGCGWTLSIRNKDTGAAPSGWTDRTIGDFQEATISVPVTTGWFQLGSHNEYEIKLFNQLNLQDAKLFVTIDDRDLAPGVPRVTVSPGPPYRQGDVLTISAESAVNAKTGAAIVEYHYLIRQGGRILLDMRTLGSVQVTIADEQIDIQVEVTAFDGSRTSGVSRFILTVLDTDLDNNPPTKPGDLPWGLVLLVAGLVAILLGLAVPLDPPIRAGIAVLGLVLILVAWLIVGIQFNLPRFFVISTGGGNLG